jgi:hypothetical protein
MAESKIAHQRLPEWAEKPSDLALSRAILGRRGAEPWKRTPSNGSSPRSSQPMSKATVVGLEEVGTLHTLTAYQVIIDRLIASHRGRIFNTAGDSLVANFVSAVDAVECAVAVQDAIAKENSN